MHLRPGHVVEVPFPDLGLLNQCAGDGYRLAYLLVLVAPLHHRPFLSRSVPRRRNHCSDGPFKGVLQQNLPEADPTRPPNELEEKTALRRSLQKRSGIRSRV
jgi:hypothetical protein